MQYELSSRLAKYVEDFTTIKNEHGNDKEYMKKMYERYYYKIETLVESFFQLMLEDIITNNAYSYYNRLCLDTINAIKEIYYFE